MIKRHLESRLTASAKLFPVVTLTGPRQSGKTTLVRNIFSKYRYISLESPDNRQFANEDPRGFLQIYNQNVIFDEVQRVPDLFSYIQTMVDENPEPGRFILTGSQNFQMLEKVSQSLAGRSAVLNLMPFSRRELHSLASLNPDNFPESDSSQSHAVSLERELFTGYYPRIHDQGIDPQLWLDSYIQTYVERDVRTIINVGDLDTFGRFLKLCAGRVCQPVNYVSLGADCGISKMTAKRWLSVLQTSYIISLVQPYYENFNKRIIKSPKLHFLDSGLLCYLLGIQKQEDLSFHAQRGPIFESFIFAELYKMYLHLGKRPAIYFWNDSKAHEVDFILDHGELIQPIEVKSGKTIAADYFRGLKYFGKIAANRIVRPTLIYGGENEQRRGHIQAISWKNI
jgi:predicted AAA+ superfamily ATPase